MSSPDPIEKKFQALADALRQAEARQPVFVPPTLDEAILRQARAHFQKPSPRQPWNLRLFSFLTTATAAIALAIFLNRPAFAPEDINRDGQVDILDALALANEIQSIPSKKPHGFDPDHIAMAAVRLNPKEGI